MKKSYYILLTITATAAVLYLLGNWVGRSFGLNRQQVIRNIHEAYGRATDAFEAGQTKDLAAFFRNELDEVNLKRIKFRLDTVSLHGDSIVLKQDLRYFSDYRKLLEQHYTFVCPVNDAQGVHAYIQNLRAGFIGKLLYMFFGTIAALGLLLFAIRKQVDIIRRQDELVNTFTAKAEKHITFQVDLQEEGAYADEEYLKEALSNLIDNAVKYSKDTIDIQITSCLSGQYIQIRVRDNGIGIPLAAQRIVFDKFERVITRNEDEKKKVSGFGLGLNYVMNVAREHGGYVSVESIEGKYSEFTVSLPLPTENEEANPED